MDVNARVKIYCDDVEKDTPIIRFYSETFKTNPKILDTIYSNGNLYLHYMSHSRLNEFESRIQALYGTSLGTSRDINVKNNFGWTPLTVAVLFKRHDNMRTLLKYGADPFVKCKLGYSIVRYAVNNLDSLKVLHEHSPTVLNDPDLLCGFLSSKLPSIDILHFLQENSNVSIDVVLKCSNRTPLALAIAKDCRIAAGMFLECGAQLELALPAFKDSIPTWVVEMVLKTKNDRIARLTNDVEVISDACYELTQKKRKVSEEEGIN